MATPLTCRFCSAPLSRSFADLGLEPLANSYVAAEDLLTIEKIEGGDGQTVTFSEVLMLGGAGEPKVGRPTIQGASVTAEIVEQGRGPKVIAFKKRRRKNWRRKKGHRQDLTTVRIKAINGA